MDILFLIFLISTLGSAILLWIIPLIGFLFETFFDKKK